MAERYIAAERIAWSVPLEPGIDRDLAVACWLAEYRSVLGREAGPGLSRANVPR